MKSFFDKKQMAGLLTVILLFVSVPFPAAASTGDVSLEFTEDEITAVTGNTVSGYEINGTELTINSSGTYILQGSCTNGSVKVKKGTTGVKLVLNGLDLTAGGSENSAAGALVCNKNTEVVIEAAEDTVNRLEDSIYNNDDNYPDNGDAENAVIKCKDGSQVTICGKGELNITANGKNGIKSGAARLTVKELDLNITVAESGNDAINAEQLLEISDGTLTISAVDDAIHSDLELNIGAEGAAGPYITVTDCNEGIEAANLSVYSGEIHVTSEDDCMNAANSDISEENPDYAFSLGIYGGSLFLYSADGDGIDSNGSLDLKGGTVEVWTANTADNQPLDSDGTMTVKGGTVFAAGGSSGAEGLNLSSDSQTYVTFGENSGGQQSGQTQPDGTEQEEQTGEGEIPPATPGETEREEQTGEGEIPPEKPDGTEREEQTGEGEIPPEKPDGTEQEEQTGEGEMPPEKPDGTEQEEQTGEGEMPPEKPDGTEQEGQTGEGEIPPEKPDGTEQEGQTGEGEIPPATPGETGQNGQTQPGVHQPDPGTGIVITEGMTVSVLQSGGTAVYTAQAAPCDVNYVFFSSPELSAEEKYTLGTGATDGDASGKEDQPDREDGKEENNKEDSSSESSSDSSDSSSSESSSDSSDSSSSESSSESSGSSTGNTSSSGSGGGGLSSGTMSAGTLAAPAGTLENGTWKQSERGWTYILEDGTKAADGWYPIKNPYAAASQNSWGWFYFDKDGVMKTGWLDDKDGNRYYLNTSSDGQMGAALLGWQKVDGSWYYFSMSTGSEHPTGSLYRDQTTPDGCTVDSDGKWIENR